jgi:hypothetical protein
MGDVVELAHRLFWNSRPSLISPTSLLRRAEAANLLPVFFNQGVCLPRWIRIGRLCVSGFGGLFAGLASDQPTPGRMARECGFHIHPTAVECSPECPRIGGVAA